MESKNFKKMLAAFGDIEEQFSVTQEELKEIICEAISKAYKKEAGIDDMDVYAVFNDKKKTIDLFQRYQVLASDDDVQDDEFEMGVENARVLDRTAVVGGTVSKKIDIDTFELFSRSSASVAKNIIRQKTSESKKQAVYNKYIVQLDDMVTGTVESVKDRSILVKLEDGTIAVLPASQLIPLDGPEGRIRRESFREGEPIRVVITDVVGPQDHVKEGKKDKKGSNQISIQLSRTCDYFVKRLFERDVPEIAKGEVIIKALARDPGKRTKMAVLSRNPDVDAIGSCIGPNGQRVKGITAELRNEKIDIFEWSDDISELVKNALAPAEIQAVLPNDKESKSLIVVVSEDQVSLAIGKKGQNSLLANKLTGYKIDIKTREQLEEAGVDYEALLQEAEAQHVEYLKEVEKKHVAKMEKAEEIKRQEQLATLEAKRQALNSNVEIEEEGFIPEEMQEAMSDRIANDIAFEQNEPEQEEVVETEEPVVEEVNVPVEETVVEETEQEEEPKEETMEENVTSAKRKHANLEEMAEKNTYVSRFEKLTDTTSKPKNDYKPKRKKKTDSEDNYRVDNKELEKQIKAKLSQQDNKPLYTEEELEEIEAQRQADEDRELGIDDDYDDEYDDYYDDED